MPPSLPHLGAENFEAEHQQTRILSRALTYNPRMMFRVQRIGDQYGVLFREEQMCLMGLYEGANVDIKPHPGVVEPDSKIEYVSMEEGIAAFERTELRHANTYRELAK